MSGRAGRAVRWALFLMLTPLVALAALIGVGFTNAVSPPIQRTVEIPVAGLSAPVRIAFLSDIHIGNAAMTPARLEAIVAQVNAAEPDIVLLGGDFIVGHEAAAATTNAPFLTQPLSRLRAPFGVYAVLGNHDNWTSADRVTAALEAANVRVLENTAVDAGRLALIGVGDAFSGHADLPAALANAAALPGAPVVFTHSPDIAATAPSAAPLILAGHTHCGQAVLPILGPVVSTSLVAHGRRLYDPRYRCGVVREPGRTTIITAGLGGGIPMRIGAPPDWWLVTLTPTR